MLVLPDLDLFKTPGPSSYALVSRVPGSHHLLFKASLIYESNLKKEIFYLHLISQPWFTYIFFRFIIFIFTSTFLSTVFILYCYLTNYPQHAAASINKPLVTHSFCGSGMFVQLSWTLRLTFSVKVLAGTAII